MTSQTSGYIVSGVPHPVLRAGRGQPTALADFEGNAEFMIDMAGTPYLVRGCGGPRDDQVRFQEKDGLSKDVRVWDVRRHGDGFQAEHVAVF